MKIQQIRISDEVKELLKTYQIAKSAALKKRLTIVDAGGFALEEFFKNEQKNS